MIRVASPVLGARGPHPQPHRPLRGHLPQIRDKNIVKNVILNHGFRGESERLSENLINNVKLLIDGEARYLVMKRLMITK